jgi:alpha-tubulin suppressor-like RCC1 family protein
MASIGIGTIATPITQQVQSGQTAALTVGLLSGYNTLAVTGGGGSLNGTTYTTGPITANTTILTSATANSVYYTVTVDVGAGTTAAPITQQVQSGQTAALTVGLRNGYNNLAVTGGGGSLNGTTYTTGPITANTTITTSATANSVYYTVTVNVGAGTTATPITQQVQSGQTAALTVGLLSGYNTLAVTGGGGSLNGTTYTTGPITANTTITTNATANSVYYTVTANVGAGTTATPITQQVQSGQTAALTVGLLSGYNTLAVTGGGGSLNGTTYTTGPITANTTITTSATPITVAINRTDNFIVAPGQTLQLRAAVFGSANQDVTWEILDGGPGSISSSGLYTAPSTPLQGFELCRVTVTSSANQAATDSVSLALQLGASADFFLVGGTDLRLAYAGEANPIYLRFGSVTGLATATVTTVLYSGPGAAPTIDPDNVLRWTPDVAAVGIQTLVVRAQSSNGTLVDLSVPVEVVAWKRLITGSCGHEGGVLASATGEFILQVPADAVQGGYSSIAVTLDVAYRVDGTRIDRPAYTGIRDEVLVRNVFPENPVAAPVTPAQPLAPSGKVRLELMRVTVPAREIDPFANNQRGMGIVQTWTGDRWGEINRGRTLFSTDWDMYEQYFRPFEAYKFAHGDEKDGDKPMAELRGEVWTKAQFSSMGIDAAACQPVLFVHGFTPEDPRTIEIDFYGSGGEGTWGRSAMMMKSLGVQVGLDVICFEFRWQTAARLEDQAYHLFLAIQRIKDLTGKNPIVFGHSFGGVLATTYALGLAENVNFAQRRVPYQNDIAHLVTIGSPLSGIRWFDGRSQFEPAPLTTNEDQISYTLGQGRDPHDSSMPLGRQWSMYCTGGNPVGYFGDIVAKPTTDPGQANFHKALGFYMEPSGYTVGRFGGKVAAFKASAGQSFPCPMTIMVAQRSGFGGLGVDDYTTTLTDGDGLISRLGQLLDPRDASLMGSYKGYVYPGFGYRYFEMPTADGYSWYTGGKPSDWWMYTKFGFAHTEVQGNGINGLHIGVDPAVDLQDPYDNHSAANAAEVKLFNLSDAYTKGVALGYALGVPGSSGQGGAQQYFPHPLYIVAEDVLKKAAASPAVLEPSDYMSARCVGQVVRNGLPAVGLPVVVAVTEAGTVTRLRGVTLADGTFDLLFEKTYTTAKPFDAAVFSFLASVGNDQDYLAKSATRVWASTVAFGAIEVTKRSDVTANAGFTGVVHTPAGATLAGATVQLRLGDGLTAASFHALNPFPQTQSSQQLASGAAGEVTVSGLLPGAYTVLVTASGYLETRFVLTLPASAPVRLQVNGGVNALTVSPASVTLSLSKSQSFTAVVGLAGGGNPNVTWSVLEAEGGSVTAAGLYLAPTVAGVYHLRAALSMDPSVFADAVITVQGTPKPSLSAGGYHGLWLHSDGTVLAWGGNSHGQLGTGAGPDSSSLGPISTLGQVTAVAAGYWHNLAIKPNGTVWAWGDNGSGQVGPNPDPNGLPATVPGLTGIKAVAASVYSSFALKDDGTVWAWGGNSYGQLGDGTTVDHATPAPVIGLDQVVAIASGSFHSLALKADGTIWAWGSNNSGELGDGTSTSRFYATQVPGLTGMVALAGGRQFSLALKADGTVWAWGDNNEGQLGLGIGVYNGGIPAQVPGLTGVQAVDCGDFHSLARKADGSILAWGRNRSGQVGDGTENANVYTPVRVADQGQMVSAGYQFSLALKADGSAWAWGDNTMGQLGDGAPLVVDRATLVNGIGAPRSIAAGSYYNSLVAKADGTVWSWGGRSSPGLVDGLSEILKVATGARFSLALKADGTVCSWGENSDGQLGDGTQIGRSMPAQVPGLTGVIAMAGQYFGTLALKADGTVWSWGNNFYGQLGDGTQTMRLTPVQVSSLTGMVAISAGAYYGLGLKGDGTVWVWGQGQAGTWPVTNALTPVQVSGLSGITALAGGIWDYGLNLALKGDGTVWVWGSGTPPTKVVGLTGVVGIANGWYHHLAFKGDGSVWAWGTNSSGQLGDGSLQNRSTPVQVLGVSGVQTLGAGSVHSLLATATGLYTFGDDHNGQLGLGRPLTFNVPTRIAAP